MSHELDHELDRLIITTKKRFKKLDAMIYKSVFEYLNRSLQVRENRITFNQNNFQALTNLGKLMDSFTPILKKVGKFIISGIVKMIGLTAKDMLRFDKSAISKGSAIMRDLAKHSATVINKKLNLEIIFNRIKQEAMLMMNKPGGASLVELRTALRDRVVGDRMAQRYFSRWTHDIYSQYQRIGANQLRIEIGLKYAIYQGGLIDNSREFCEDKNGQCFSYEEIESWKDEDFEGRPETGYNPIIDCGGYNCRHRLDWISEELARRLRPDLFKQKVA